MDVLNNTQLRNTERPEKPDDFRVKEKLSQHIRGDGDMMHEAIYNIWILKKICWMSIK